jgi:hypothetical protein
VYSAITNRFVCILKKYIFLLFITAFLVGCAGAKFTFTGANLSPEIKTLTIINFYNDATDGPANLGINFTESLKEYFQRNTKLVLVPAEGHLQFEGKIIGYTVTPMAQGAQASQSAQLQRLTITVEVIFTNNKEDEKDFKQNFSFFADFSASQNLRDVETTLVPQIFDQIIFDIFNKSVANW